MVKKILKIINDRRVIYNPKTKIIKERDLYSTNYDCSNSHYQVPLSINEKEVVIANYTTNPHVYKKYSSKIFNIDSQREQHVIFHKMPVDLWVRTLDIKKTLEIKRSYDKALLEYVKINEDKIVSLIIHDEQVNNLNTFVEDRLNYLEELKEKGIESKEYSKDSEILQVNPYDYKIIDKQVLNKLYDPELLKFNVENLSEIVSVSDLLDIYDYNNFIKKEEVLVPMNKNIKEGFIYYDMSNKIEKKESLRLSSELMEKKGQTGGSLE